MIGKLETGSLKMYHLKVSSFTVELISSASFGCYPINTLNSFTNFPPEKINLDGELALATKT